MFKLYLIDPENGVIINLKGAYSKGGEDLGYLSLFDDFGVAVTEKDRILEIVVWACVQIVNLDTKEEHIFSNREIELEYLSERRQWATYLNLPWYKKLLASKPVLKYVKEQK